MEKYNKIQLTKNKMDSNNRNMKNHPPSPSEIPNKPNLHL